MTTTTQNQAEVVHIETVDFSTGEVSKGFYICVPTDAGVDYYGGWATEAEARLALQSGVGL